MDGTKRDGLGRWVVETQSPNPHGRPPGSGPSAAMRAAVVIEVVTVFVAEAFFASVFRCLREVLGGGSGIRTHDTVSGVPAFQASALDHSAIPPTGGT